MRAGGELHGVVIGHRLFGRRPIAKWTGLLRWGAGVRTGAASLEIEADTVAGIQQVFGSLGADTAAFSYVAQPDVPAMPTGA